MIYNHSMTHITEPERNTAVAKETDVLVAGGGIAGVAAAVAAARQGARVILLEKEYGLGGLATLGNVIIYLPLCDGRGRQVIGGLGEELLKLSAKEIPRSFPGMGLEDIPEVWTRESSLEERRRARYRTGFNPAYFQLALEELLQKEGVEICYDNRLVWVNKTDGRLTHVIIENKSGRLAVSAGAFVDATGDADLCAFAGENTAQWPYNVLCGWHYALEEGSVKLHSFSRPFKFTNNGQGCAEPHLSGVEADQVTRQVLESRRLIRERCSAKGIHPFALPSIPSFRATRRLNNRFVLKWSQMHEYFDDTVGLTGDWRQAGPVFALPLRAIRADANPNLFAAGRCISTETEVWDVTRVIPTCAVTGEAAGTAAALTALEHDGDGSLLEIGRLQGALSDQGVLLDRELVREIS